MSQNLFYMSGFQHHLAQQTFEHMSAYRHNHIAPPINQSLLSLKASLDNNHLGVNYKDNIIRTMTTNMDTSTHRIDNLNESIPTTNATIIMNNMKMSANGKTNNQNQSSIHNHGISKRASRAQKSKRIRTIFTPEQLKRLEYEFSHQMYLVGQDRGYLAKSLNLTESQVKVWFQNRRIKLRKGPASANQEQGELKVDTMDYETNHHDHQVHNNNNNNITHHNHGTMNNSNDHTNDLQRHHQDHHHNHNHNMNNSIHLNHISCSCSSTLSSSSSSSLSSSS